MMSIWKQILRQHIDIFKIQQSNERPNKFAHHFIGQVYFKRALKFLSTHFSWLILWYSNWHLAMIPNIASRRKIATLLGYYSNVDMPKKYHVLGWETQSQIPT